jgi:aryl-alcohol dehydrogenase-like predicted oxidoreductase
VAEHRWSAGDSLKLLKTDCIDLMQVRAPRQQLL